MEIADPPKPAPQQTRGGGMFGFGGGGAGRGAGLGMPAGNSVSANLAASLMQRLQQAQQQPGARSAPAAQVLDCTRLAERGAYSAVISESNSELYLPTV